MMRLIHSYVGPGSEHTNLTAETTLNNGSASIAAGGAVLGKRFRWTGGVRCTSTNSTDTLAIKLKLGGTAVYSPSAVDVADNDILVWDLELVPRTAAGSTSGAILVSGRASVLAASGTGTMREVYALVSSLDLTAAIALIVTGTWSVASASNQVHVSHMALYEIVSEA